jgi:predicted DNA binding CopG/RHH family protein
MKKRITLTLSADIVKYIKTEAKKRGIPESQLVEEAFLEIIAREEVKDKLKKVS